MDYTKKLSDDNIRNKIDGFTLENSTGSESYTFKTIDQGVYFPPDDRIDEADKKS